MIISASRRTDIPAFFGKWFYNRIKEGFCTVPNPFNINQVSFVDLRPENVDAIVFWTRNPFPIISDLDFYDKMGYNYYFQFTLNNYSDIYEPCNPSFESSIKHFQVLSSKIGASKVIWRYDPIIINRQLTVDYHIENFTDIFNELKDYTKRIVLSIVDVYRKTERRLNKIGHPIDTNSFYQYEIEKLLSYIVNLARQNNIIVQSCAEPTNYEYLGITQGKCIDEELLNKEFGLKLPYKKDKSQRLSCGCIISKDIGMNNTCLMGCEYCYATSDHKIAIQNKRKHDPNFSSLIKHDLSDEMREKIENFRCGSLNSSDGQFNLF